MISQGMFEDIKAIQGELPIESPKQLYLRKGDEYVESYDPVTEITINEHSIDIVGSGDHVYNHSYDVFDKIYITTSGEPVVLARED